MRDAPQVQAPRLAWLATVTFATTWRWASKDIELQKGGVSVDVRWGLETDEQLEQLGASSPPPTIAFPWPGTVRELLDHADGATAELALVPVDAYGVARWEDRLVVAGGTVRDIEVDPQTMVASVQLESMERTDTADLCPASFAVSRTTWPLATEESWGARVPFVYGEPGSFAYATVTDTDTGVVFDYTDPQWWTTPTITVIRETRTTGATPAIPIDAETLYVAAEFLGVEYVASPRYLAVCQGWTDATSVTLWVKNPDIGWTVRDGTQLIRAYDGLGQPVMLAVLVDDLARSAGEWWVGWTDGGAGTGALGALTVEVLRRSSVPVDWTSVLAVAAWLDRYRIGGYVDDTITPLRWVTDRLRPFGVSVRWTANGLGLLASHGTAEPVARLEVGGDATRAGPLKIAAAEIDGVVVTWAANRGADKRQMRTVARRRGAAGSRVEEMAAPEVWDETTAAALAMEALATNGPVREQVLAVPTVRWWWLRAGDVVELVDEAIGADGLWRVVAARHSTGAMRQITVREIIEEAVLVASGDDTGSEAGR